MNWKQSDVIKAFEWGKKNPESSWNDYLDSISKRISRDELHDLNSFKYDKTYIELDGKSYEFTIISNFSYYLNLESLPVRLAGNKPYYLLNPMPGEWDSGICVLSFDSDFFNLKKWNLMDDYLYHVGNDKLKFTFYSPEEYDEDSYQSKNRFEDSLGDEYYKLWDYQSELHGWIKRDFNWKPIGGLFEVID